MTLEEIQKAAESGPHCFLYREALRRDWVDPDCIVNSTGMWHVKYQINRPAYEQFEAWLCESLATALEHPDPMTRLRATLQAYEYTGRLKGMGAHPGSRYSDALLEARNLLESQLRK